MSSKKTGNTLSCSLLMYLPQKKSADAKCAPWATARGTALRAVKVLSPDQILPEPLQHSQELFVDKDTLRPRARAPSPWHSTLVPRPESNKRASGLRHDVFNRIGPLISNVIAKPSGLAAVHFDFRIARTPERAYLALARAMVIQALATVLASPVSH